MMGFEVPELAAGWIAGGGWVDPFTAFVAAFVFGQILAWTYEFTFAGMSYSRSFSHAVVLVCLSASILVQAMQHSWLAGLGLFGILSMIRFRTDLKTPRDLVYVMGAACVGVASGVGAIVVAARGYVRRGDANSAYAKLGSVFEPGGGEAEAAEIEMPEVRVHGESAGPRVFASLTEGDDGDGETCGGGTAARTS